MKEFIRLWFKCLFIVLAGVFTAGIFCIGWALIDTLSKSYWYPILGMSWTVLWVVTGITVLCYRFKGR